VSKRHQSSRRRTYGRRQHEIHERQAERRHHPADDDLNVDGFGIAPPVDPLAFLDPRAPRLRFVLGE
jgi:hypothetical protein